MRILLRLQTQSVLLATLAVNQRQVLRSAEPSVIIAQALVRACARSSASASAIASASGAALNRWRSGTNSSAVELWALCGAPAAAVYIVKCVLILEVLVDTLRCALRARLLQALSQAALPPCYSVWPAPSLQAKGGSGNHRN